MESRPTGFRNERFFMAKGKLILIDGHSLAYRAFHALPADLQTSNGELTNAVLGFTSMLLGVLRDENPDYIAIAFDKGRTFRHDIFAEYKAHRVKMPGEMAAQMERIQQIVAAFHIPSFEIEGYEADDLLGTLAHQAESQGVDTLIVTGDTDALQLVSGHTRVLTSRWRFSDTVTYDVEGVRKRYEGLEPHQLIDLKALIGDKSDNIPGVAGVGEKTAIRLLQKYTTLEGIYEHLDEIEPERFRKALKEGRQAAFLSQHLARIVTDTPVQLDLEACRTHEYDREQVMNLFRELEFRTLVDRLPPFAPSPSGIPQQLPLFEEKVTPRQKIVADYQVVASEAELETLAARLRQAPAITLDVETTATDALAADLVGIALTDAERRGYYIPVGHTPIARIGDDQQPRSGNLPLDLVWQKLGPILEDRAIAKYAHNAKYDLEVLVRHGAAVQGLAFDTMIAEWLCNPASGNLSLKNLAWARLKVEMTAITELIGKGRGQITMAQVPIEAAARYACADADMTHRLVAVLQEELHARNQWPLFTEVEIPLVSVLMDVELAGVKLDLDVLAAMSRDLRRRLAELEQQIQEMVGYAFNVSSTQQLSEALFIKLGLTVPGLRKTKSGHYSTAADILDRMRGQHEVIDLILEHRQLDKLKSTYVDALPALLNHRTGRVHTSFNQTGTVTGRISSSNPNLQNIPIRTELGREVRRAFVAEEGWRLISADYSQVELRIMAHISQDRGLLDAFARGEDIHASTAAAVLGIPISEVTPEMRRLAKSVNFGLSYGQGAYGLAQTTGQTPEEAARFIETYFARFPGVRRYIETTKRQATDKGYVETLRGRRRYFPELGRDSKVSGQARQAAERMAINMPIQGSAADIIKIAMINLHKELSKRGLKSRIILQVHDELVLEAPESEVAEVTALVCHTMEGAFRLDAPLKVDVGVGQNWLEVK
jgi:DNA polymerase-1